MSNTINLTAESLKILKSFSQINPGIVFKPGQRLQVAHKLKEIIGFADVGIEIKDRFAIYDMTKFLGVVSLHDKDSLVLEYDSNVIHFKSKNAKTKYRTTDETNVTAIPDQFGLVISEKNAEFTISAEVLDEIKSISNSLSLPHVVLTSDATEQLNIKVTEIGNDASDEHFIFPEVAAKGPFVNVVFKAETLSKLMPGVGYTVEANRKFAHFVSLDKKLEYFVSLEVERK